MFKKIIVAVIACTSLFWGTATFAGVSLHDGLWEITSSMEIQGMEMMKMPSHTYTQCITKKNIVPQDEHDNSECKVTDQNIHGNTVTWSMKCSGQDAMKMTGKITYHGDTFDGTMTMISNDPQSGPMRMVSHIKGKRIGECR